MTVDMVVEGEVVRLSPQKPEDVVPAVRIFPQTQVVAVVELVVPGEAQGFPQIQVAYV